MINLSLNNKLAQSHQAQGSEPETHQSKAIVLSLTTTVPSSTLTFSCNGAKCGNKAEAEGVIANRVSERGA